MERKKKGEKMAKGLGGFKYAGILVIIRTGGKASTGEGKGKGGSFGPWVREVRGSWPSVVGKKKTGRHVGRG